jgi:hypothetical protein
MVVDVQSIVETLTVVGTIVATVYQMALAPLRARMDELEDRLEDIAANLGMTPRPRAKRKERRR